MKLLNKKTALVAAVAGMFALASCDGEGLAITVDNQTIEIEMEVLATPDTGSITFNNDTLVPNLQDALDDLGQGQQVSDITSISLMSIAVEIDDDSSMVTNFDPIETMNASFGAPGLPTAIVAALDPAPNGVDSLSLVPQTTEILDYLTAPEIYLNLQGRTDAPIIDDVKLKVTVGYSITLTN